MAQPNSSEKIVSTPAMPGQPYDPADNAPLDRWKKLDANAGPCSINTGRGGGHWPDTQGWQQT